MSTKITNLTMQQILSLALCKSDYGLQVHLTRTTATFPDDAAVTGLRLREVTRAMNAAGASRDDIRDVSRVNRKVRIKNAGRPLPAFNEAIRPFAE